MLKEDKSPELLQAYNVVKSRIVRNATDHLPGVDMRTAVALRQSGILQQANETALDPKIFEILTDQEHPSRIQSLTGPNLVYKNDENSSEQFIFEVATGFFEPSAALRDSCLSYILSNDEASPNYISKDAKRFLVEHRGALLDNRNDVWEKAALECYDVLEEDFIFALSGLRQTLGLRFHEGIRRYSEKVMRPSRGCVEKAMASVSSLDEQSSSIAIEKIISIASLEDMCESYARDFGYLPFASNESFAVVLGKWLSNAEDVEGLANRIWEWALSSKSPVARYIACSYSLQNTRELSSEERSYVIEFLTYLVNRDEGEVTDVFGLKAKLRESLALYFCIYLRVSYPAIPEEYAAPFAWWVADLLIDSLSDNDWSIRFFSNEFVDQYVEMMAWVTQVNGGPFSISNLGIITSYRNDPWVISLLTLLGGADDVLVGEKAFKLIEGLNKFLTKVIFSRACYLSRKEGEEEFIFERSGFAQLISLLSNVGEKSEYGEALQSLYLSCGELTKGQSAIEKFSKIENHTETDQLLLVAMLKHAVLTEAIPFSDVWSVVSDKEWAIKNLIEASPAVLSSLFELLSIGQQMAEGSWSVEIPHIYATACENQELNKDRMEILFIFVVISSMQAFSASAIERLLKGPLRQTLEKGILDARSLLTNRLSDAPSWVALKARSVLSRLH